MDNFLLRRFMREAKPRGRVELREAEARSTADAPSAVTASSGSFEERVVRASGVDAALTVSAVYRATELRAKTEAQFLMQYQRRDARGGNFVEAGVGDAGGRTARHNEGLHLNYLLQVQPNPTMSASAFFEGLVTQRLMLGNGIAYIERDRASGEVKAFWLTTSASYNQQTGRYQLQYVGERGVVQLVNVERGDVIHLPNTFKTRGGLWGLPTLKYAFDTLSLIKTENRQALESAAKGGRVKLLIGEDPQGSFSPISKGLFDPGQMKSYAAEISREIYAQDVVSLRGLDKVHQISMSAQEMQMVELLGMGVDDVARFWGTPRPLLMADTNSHYTTYQNATMEYLTRTVQPDIVETEQEFMRKLLAPEDFGRRRIHMCEQPLLRLDREAQAKVDEIALRTGRTVNEIRAQYDLPLVEKGDTVYVSTNLAELGSEKLRGGSNPC